MNNKKVLCFLTLGAVLMSSSVFAQDKVALVIGNAKYKDLPLKNPVNDAKDMKAMLEKAGFTVIYADDAEIDEMDEATNKFIDSLDRNSLSLFYYSGHGLQVNGVNYLLPINANIKTDNADTLGTSLKRGAYSTNDLLSRLEGVKNPTNIVILDACRNNPLDKPSGEKGLYVSKGLGIEEASDSFLVAYATAPGKVATDDQKSKNSLYTKYLKQYLFEPGLTIESALKKVSKSVKKENPSQVPWYNNSIDEELCLAGCSVSPPTTPKTTYAPLLSFVSGANSVTQNKSYAVKFTGTDSDGDLNKILIDWGDGTAITAKTAKNGIAVSFSHTYKFAGMFDLIATAVDKQNAESETYSKEVQVNEVVVSAPVITTPVVVVEAPKVPNISNATASPSSIIKGNSITFSASLSLALPSGYVVKVNYGNGFVSMNGSGTSFNLTAIPNSSAAYRVGVYDSAGVLKSNELTGNFEVTQPAPVNVAPTLSFISGNTSAMTNAAYSVQLQAVDSDNNLSSIAINWGDGASDTQTATNSSTLTFSHTYTSEKTYNWSATASDSGSLKSNVISKNVAVSKPVVVVPPVEIKPTTSTTKGDVETFVSGDRTFSYTKIANDGSELPKTAKLGTAPKDWACTKDNKTGLIWEVKTDDGKFWDLETDDGGLRDKNGSYTWYEPNTSKNGGDAGTQNGGFCKGSDCDTYAFTNAVNKQSLCGAKDWTVPNNEELKGLIYCSDGKYSKLVEGGYGPVCSGSPTSPTINTVYFPDLTGDNYFFWSSSFDANNSAYAGTIIFSQGTLIYDGKNGGSVVRLVRNLNSSSGGTVEASKSVTPTTSGDVETFISGDKTFSYTKIANDGSALPKTAKLGTAPTDWACTKDNKTGLIWEVKTDDDGLRDLTKTYTLDDYFNFPIAVNAEGLCGAKDWRLPTIQELGGVLVCSDGKYKNYGNDYGQSSNGVIDCTNYNSDTLTRPTINTTYFPNTQSYWFWSSSPEFNRKSGSGNLWIVHFYRGYSGYSSRNGYSGYVRLVRG